jgi:membrane fusion protein (multidrug efflux system)
MFSIADDCKRIILVLAVLSGLAGCGQKGNAPPAQPPPEVTVIKVSTAPVTVFDDYAAQTEAVEAVEIRARVGGLLQKQAFKDGAPVKKGDLLFVIDQELYAAALAQARADLGQAQAAWLNSRQNLARLRPLLAFQAISQQDLDAAVATERADAASVEAAKAGVREAELNFGYTTIRAPRDGMISRALIKPGGLVNASTTLLTTLYSVDPIYATFTISEQKLVELQNRFRQHDRKTLNLPDIGLKLIDGSDYRYSGKIDFLDAAVDPKNGTLPVRLVVANPEGELRPGQFVRAIVPARQNPNAILVPQKAVQELQGKHSVFVVGPDNKALYRDITVGARVGNNWIVERGLKPGELVVVEGVGKVKPGIVVKPVQPAQAPQAPQSTQPAKTGG